MASAWGASFSGAWGNAWGAITAVQQAAPSVGIGRRDLRKKRRAERDRLARRRRELEFFAVAMP